MSIAVGVALNPPETGVDTKEDLERINKILEIKTVSVNLYIA